MTDEIINALVGASPAGVLSIFAYFALMELRQLRAEVSNLSASINQLVGQHSEAKAS